MNEHRITPNILMFAPSCYPPGNPEAFVNANLVLAALEAGWGVDVITMADSGHWYPNTGEAWRRLASCVVTVAERERTLANRFLVAARSFMLSGQRVSGGHWAIPAAKEAMRLTSKKNYDYIVSRALPPEAHLSALIVSRKTGIPWIANWNDPVPWEKFPRQYPGGKGKHAPLGYLTARYYREVAKQALWHTFPCERLRAYIAGYLPGDIRDKSSVVPHIALDRRNPASRSNKGFTLMHAGSLRSPRSPDVFLKGVRLFRERANPGREFSVVFIVDRPEDVRRSAGEHGLEALVRIEKSRPYTEMPEVLRSATVLVIIEALVEEGIFLPSKFADYVGVGRPILAISPRTGTLSDVLGEHGGGIAVDGGSAEAVAHALHVLYEHWLNNTLDEHYNTSNLYGLFAVDTVLDVYREIFDRITLPSPQSSP